MDRSDMIAEYIRRQVGHRRTAQRVRSFYSNMKYGQDKDSESESERHPCMRWSGLTWGSRSRQASCGFLHRLECRRFDGLECFPRPRPVPEHACC